MGMTKLTKLPEDSVVTAAPWETSEKERKQGAMKSRLMVNLGPIARLLNPTAEIGHN